MKAGDDQPRLSLCMIVRNPEDTLRPCLSSIQPWVDEMIIVDTGSTDDTKSIIKEFTPRSYEFPWCDDFSAARNESIEPARGKWLFWMDADDVIEESHGRRLRELAYAEHPQRMLAYVVQVVCPGGDNRGAEEATVVDHVKLFRNDPQIRFEFRIHEQLLPSIRRLGGEVGWSGVEVVHANADHTPSGKQGKYERDLRILELEIKERPDHSFALFNFGMTYSDMGEHARAAEYLERCLQVAPPEESQVVKAYALLVHSYDQLEQLDRAWQVCEKARELFPNDIELLFREGKLAHDRLDHEQAEASYRAILSRNGEKEFASIDRGIAGYKARHNLALCYADMGRLEDAELQWRMILEEHPRYRSAWRSLGKLLLEQQRVTSAEVLRDALRTEADFAAEAALLAAAIEVAFDQPQRALELLDEAARSFPDDTAILEEHSRLQFSHGEPAAASRTLLALVKSDPSNGAAMHNLGALHMQVGDYEAAVQWYERSLAARPDAQQTHREYAAALEAAGRAPDGQVFLRTGEIPSTTGAETSIATPATNLTNQRLSIGVVTIGYNLPGATEKLIDSALVDCPHEVQFGVFSHSRFPEKARELEALAQRDCVQYFDYGTNRGLAKSWNEGILWGFAQGHDVVLVVNEDIVFDPGDLARLAAAASEQDDRFLVMGHCHHASEDKWESSEYGCFAYNRLALDTLGMFDENIFPIYYEDSDYRRRASLAGLEPGLCRETHIRHQGSASLAQAEVAAQNQHTYAGNRAYFMRKWGGDGGEERFQRPFDDPRFNLYIDPRVRERPYPGFDRTDQDIVKL